MNILIIGLGSIAKQHINALKSLNETCSIYALRSSSNANKYDSVTNIYSLDEIKGINIAFGIISNPTSEHKKSILQLLDIQCPLFIEKPLYHTLDIEDILTKVKELGVLTYVACNLRFLDCMTYVKEYIKNNSYEKLNEVNVYCGSFLPEWRQYDYKKSYSAIPELGGGVHIDLIHEIDYLYWIFGSPITVQSILKNNSSLNIKAYDYANYCLEYKHFCASIILNYYRRDYKRTFELIFENETLLIDLNQNNISSNGEIIFKSTQNIKDTYVPQMKYFLELVNSKQSESFNSIFDAYNVLKITL